MDETLQTDVGQVSPEEIPDKYWSKCDLCVEKLPGCSLEVEPDY